MENVKYWDFVKRASELIDNAWMWSWVGRTGHFVCACCRKFCDLLYPLSRHPVPSAVSFLMWKTSLLSST